MKPIFLLLIVCIPFACRKSSPEISTATTPDPNYYPPIPFEQMDKAWNYTYQYPQFVGVAQIKQYIGFFYDFQGYYIDSATFRQQYINKHAHDAYHYINGVNITLTTYTNPLCFVAFFEKDSLNRMTNFYFEKNDPALK